jgi:hypothetical protein
MNFITPAFLSALMRDMIGKALAVTPQPARDRVAAIQAEPWDQLEDRYVWSLRQLNRQAHALMDGGVDLADFRSF